MIFATFFSYSGVIPKLELESLYIFISSIKNNYPESDVVIITDHQSASFFRSEGLKVFPAKVEQQTLLLDRVRSYKKLMEKFDQESLFVFMDFDMILLKRFDFLEESFDCAYTLRSKLKQHPINGGLAVYRNTEKGLEIISKVIDCYEALPNEQKQWWGDQISISSLLLSNNSSLESGMHLIVGGKILLLDAFLYNWTPHDFDVSFATLSRNLFIDRPLADWVSDGLISKYIVHFKGPRKHLQHQFWRQAQGSMPLYFDELHSHLVSEKRQITESGKAYFVSRLARTNSLFQLLDLAVLSVLNIFNDEKFRAEREGIIDFIHSCGDPRAKTLLGESLDRVTL